MHIGFKEYKLHLSWVPIIYFSLALFISIFFLGILFILVLWQDEEKDVSKKGSLVSFAKLMGKDNVFTKRTEQLNWNM